MQSKIDSEIKVISNTDEIMSDQVLMWAKQEEALRTQVLESEHTKKEMRKKTHADIVDTYTHLKDVQNKGRYAQDAVR